MKVDWELCARNMREEARKRRFDEHLNSLRVSGLSQFESLRKRKHTSCAKPELSVK